MRPSTLKGAIELAGISNVEQTDVANDVLGGRLVSVQNRSSTPSP
jgi:hypothetical protein